MPDMDFDTWHKYGMRRGFCGPTVCYTHDGLPTTETEDEEFADGFDPCIHVIRPYDSAETLKAVQDNHPPSQWRKPL